MTAVATIAVVPGFSFTLSLVNLNNDDSSAEFANFKAEAPFNQGR